MIRKESFLGCVWTKSPHTHHSSLYSETPGWKPFPPRQTPPGGARLQNCLFLTAWYSSERQRYTELLHTEAEEEEGQNSQYISIIAVCTHTEPPGEPKEEEVLSLGRTFML